MLLEQTLSTLSHLKLIGMQQALKRQIDQTHDLSFEERLGLLVDEEKAYRESKKIDRLLAQAKFRQKAFIEDIDYRHSRNLKREDMSTLISHQWLDQAFNLLITGPTGLGKSWIACALGHQACRHGYSVFYIRLTKLLEDLRLAYVDGSYAKYMHKLAKFDLLILDDWGLEQFNQEQRRHILEIIEDRHCLKSILITSQIPCLSWHEVIGDPTIADAILDRLLHRHRKLELTGESMRKQQNKIAS